MPTSIFSTVYTTLRRRATALVQWFDADYMPEGADKMRATPDQVDWMRCIPFVILHAGCLGLLWVGWSPFAVGTAARRIEARKSENSDGAEHNLVADLLR